MKIGLIIYGSLDILTGGFMYDRKVVEYLAFSGHSVQVFALPWRTYPQHLSDNFSGSFLKRLASSDVDIWVQDELNHPSLFYLNRRLRKMDSRPIVSIVHHLRMHEQRPAWRNQFYKIIERDYLDSITGFIYNSDTTKNSVQTLLNKSKPHCVAFPGREAEIPMVDESYVISRSRQEGPLRILFVGSWIPRKELHTLVLALAELNSENWLLNIVGDQNADKKYSAYIHKLIEEAGVSERISIDGALERSELMSRYNNAHLLAVPSSYEGFGIVYLEGMGHGLPAIASNTGAARETVNHGVTGFLVNPGDAHELAGYIEILMNDRDKLAKMGIAGLKRYASHPTWEETGKKIANFLQGLVV